MHIIGLDLSNTFYLKSQYPIISVNSDGNPVSPLRPYEINSKIWNDKNKNQILDPGENGISDVSVNLLDSNGYLLESATSDSEGNFSFDVEGETIDPDTEEAIYDGIYRLRIDEVNFQEGGALFGYDSSSLEKEINVSDDENINLNSEFGVFQNELPDEEILITTGENINSLIIIFSISLIFIIICRKKHIRLGL